MSGEEKVCRSRLLFVSTTYPTPSRPRQGAFNRILVESLRQGHEVRVVSPVPWIERVGGPFRRLRSGSDERAADERAADERAADERAADERWVAPGWQSCPTFFYPPKVARSRYGRFYTWSVRGALDRASAAIDPQWMLAYWAHPDGEAAVDFAERRGIPAVVMVGGSDIRMLTRNPSRRARIRDVLVRASRVITLSRDLARRVEALGVDRGCIDVTYRGIDRETFFPESQSCARSRLGIDDDTVLLVWVGRLVAVKNPGLLIEAARAWKGRWGSRLRVEVIGEGPLSDRVRSAARRGGVGDVVSMRGGRHQSELADWYRAADVTVLTSDSEGVPNVLLESIACGCRFVATDVGGVGEIADPNLDRLVPAGDADGVSHAVIELAERRQAELAERRSFEARREGGDGSESLPPRTFRPRSVQGFAADVARSGWRAMEESR